MINVLIVANPEAYASMYVYNARCTGDMSSDVRKALKHLDIFNDRIAEGIAAELNKGKNFWLWIHSKSYCFDKITV